MTKIGGFYITVLLALGLFPCASAQQPDETRIEKVESELRQLRNESATRQQLATEVGNLRNEVNRLRADVRDAAGPGVGLFLFGVVCALWAQNTGRNAWLWFFLGLIFSVITGLVLLYKNSQDRKTLPHGV